MSDDEKTSPGEEPVSIPLEDSLDLHAFSPRDTADLLEEYLFQCHRAGLREVRIIHGKGIGAQRRQVHAHLTHNPLIERFYPAPAEAGGWGATIAVLKAAGRNPE